MDLACHVFLRHIVVEKVCEFDVGAFPMRFYHLPPVHNHLLPRGHNFPQWPLRNWCVFVTIIIVAGFTFGDEFFHLRRNWSSLRYSLYLSSSFYLLSKLCFSFLAPGSTEAVIGSPSNKWTGVRAVRSLGLADIVVTGREFKNPSISTMTVSFVRQGRWCTSFH